MSDRINLDTITLRWRGMQVVCHFDSRGWDFNIDRYAKNAAGQYLIPPHSTDEEVYEEFERDLNETAIGRYMADVVGGSGTV